MNKTCIAVLITCHNRRETTLACLQRLFAQELPENTEFSVFLVDDGCTDGTGGAVKREFPSVNIILGDGNLYWNQGMRLAWRCAYRAGDWDGYLWLNDDTMLLDGALRTMLETMDSQEKETGKRGIVVGSCREPVIGASVVGASGVGEPCVGGTCPEGRGEAKSKVDGGREPSGEEQPPAQGGLRPGGGAKSKVEGVKGKEHRAWSKEELPESNEPRTKNQEQITTNHKPLDHLPTQSSPSSTIHPVEGAAHSTGIIHQSSDKIPCILSYGGRDERGLVMPTDDPQPIKAFNGNFVLVSRETFKQLGNLNGAYRHSFGDIDYGIRAQKAGVPIWLTPHFLGECGRNPTAKWRDPSVPLSQRWKAFRGPKGFSTVELKAFATVRGQRFWLLSVFRQHLIVLFPRLVDHGRSIY